MSPPLENRGWIFEVPPIRHLIACSLIVPAEQLDNAIEQGPSITLGPCFEEASVKCFVVLLGQVDYFHSGAARLIWPPTTKLRHNLGYLPHNNR